MGTFITFEGTEGSGKSTVSKAVFEHFKALGYDVMLTREPGGIDISESIRDIILDTKHHTMDDRTEALLYAASRRQHLIEKVIPALAKGTLVLCDRYVDSSIAYQGYGRELGAEAVWNVNQFAIESVMPVRTLFLDVDWNVGKSRIQGRNFLDRLELAEDAFHKRVYKGYQVLATANPQRIISIDANQSVETVIQACIDKIMEVIETC